MRFSLKSIYFQVLLSFLLVIFSTLVISTIIEYYTYASQLPELFTELRSKTIAQHLSSAYTRDNGWDNLNSEIQRLNNLESLNTIDDTTLRIIIRDNDGRTVYNSFLNITRIKDDVLIEGESQPIIDFKTKSSVGVLTVYISQGYILRYADNYAGQLIKSGVYKALLTALIAVILSLFLSRSLTRPVIQLTDAAQAVAEGGKSRQILFTSTNELGRLSSTFNSMLSSLQTQQNLRKQLIADVSHEINTPLNAIRLEARGLSDGLVSAEEAGYHIIKEIDALKNIIYDLDWLAETDSGAYVLNKEEYKIQDLIIEESRRWLNKAGSRNIEMKIPVFNQNIPPVMIDVVRMTTVVGNLIDNAVKYSPDGSQINIGCGFENNIVKISVCDNGPAIAAEYQPHVFERFYRAEAVSSERPGRGLGLSIVKQIIELHRGCIYLECGKKSGNCFVFTLPVDPGR